MYAQFLRLLTPVGLYLPEFLHSAFFSSVALRVGDECIQGFPVLISQALGFVSQVCWQRDGDGFFLV